MPFDDGSQYATPLFPTSLPLAISSVDCDSDFVPNLTNSAVGGVQTVTHYSNLSGAPIPVIACPLAIVTVQWHARVPANAACFWTVGFRDAALNPANDIILTSIRKHNQNVSEADIGATVTAAIANPSRFGAVIHVYTLCDNDVGSGGGVNPGYLQWSVSWIH